MPPSYDSLLLRYCQGGEPSSPTESNSSEEAYIDCSTNATTGHVNQRPADSLEILELFENSFWLFHKVSEYLLSTFQLEILYWNMRTSHKPKWG